MSESRFTLLLILLGASVFGGVWAFMRSERKMVQLTPAEFLQPALPARSAPIAEIARSLRTMKLVTVEVETAVASKRFDGSWRGDVAATVVAPARLLYGCDLSGIGEPHTGQSATLIPNLLSGGYTLRVPRPSRIATEVEGDRERSMVDVGWGRFRDLSGEHQLGLARSGLYEEARQIRLTPDQAREVETATREQLATLVRAFAGAMSNDGPSLPVHVEFFSPDLEGVAGAEVIDGGGDTQR